MSYSCCFLLGIISFDEKILSRSKYSGETVWRNTHFEVENSFSFICMHGSSVVFDCLWPHGACQAPLSMQFFRQDYMSGLPFPSPGCLPDPGIKPMSLVSPASAGRLFMSWATGEAQYSLHLEPKSVRFLLLYQHLDC